MIEQEGSESPEARNEYLWDDKDVVSFSLRRHSSYIQDPDSRLRGGLSMEQAEEVREAADAWRDKLPEDSEVTIFASPSGLPAKWKVETDDAGEEKILETVMVQRANITSSIYEKEVFGLQQPRFDKDHQPLPDRHRLTDPRLGDILEHAQDGTQIRQFFKALAADYKGLTPQFWQDWLEGRLQPEVAEKLASCGGARPIDLALELSDFLAGERAELAKKDRKEVGLVITHGEKLEAYQHFLNQFLRENDQLTDIEESRVDYNQGYDIHMTDQNATVALPDHQLIEVDYQQFQNYLEMVKED